MPPINSRCTPLRKARRAWPLQYGLAAALCLALHPARAGEPVQISMTPDHWTTVAGTVNFVVHMGKPSIELQAGDFRKGIPT